MDAPIFGREELLAIMDDADCSLLNESGALDRPGHWLGLVKDLCRFARSLLKEIAELRRELDHERGVRLGSRSLS